MGGEGLRSAPEGMPGFGLVVSPVREFFSNFTPLAIVLLVELEQQLLLRYSPLSPVNGGVESKPVAGFYSIRASTCSGWQICKRQVGYGMTDVALLSQASCGVKRCG